MCFFGANKIDYVFKLILAEGSGANAVIVNELIDGVLEESRRLVAGSDQETVPLPDANESFSHRVGPLRVKGSFRTEGAKFGNIGSVRRTGDTLLTVEEDKISVKIEMGLDEAYVSVGAYWAEVGHVVRARGRLNLKVERNSVSGRVTLRQVGNRYKAHLDYVNVDVLEGFDVSLTGFGAANSLGARVLEWLAREFNAEIKKRISEVLSQNIQRALDKTDISELLSNLIR